MPNKNLFFGPEHDTTNNAGGKAYKRSSEEALAQYACTGCLYDTYYVKAQDHLKTVKALADEVSDEFLAKCAVYAREEGKMKDMPAMLLTLLRKRNVTLFKQAFPRVVNNGKMLHTVSHFFLQTGQKLGSGVLKTVYTDWLNNASDKLLLNASVGNDPTLKDIIKLVRPKPKDAARAALFAYILGGETNIELRTVKIQRAHKTEVTHEELPQIVVDLIKWQKGHSLEMPRVDFRLGTGTQLSKEQWTAIARTSPWNMTRINLNTFLRHGVFDSKEMVDIVAERLSSAELIKKANAFPYDIFSAYRNINSEMPCPIVDALHDAIEIAVDNVPVLDGSVYICVDTSGSMGGSATGGYNSTITCSEVAALFACSMLRTNRHADMIQFDTQLHPCSLEPRDTILSNTQRMRAPGWGTDCSLPMAKILEAKKKYDYIIYVSDNESWADRMYGGVGMHQLFDKYKKTVHKKAKLVCIDITPNTSTQAKTGQDILNVGGFSDAVFTVISNFFDNKTGFVDKVKSTEL